MLLVLLYCMLISMEPITIAMGTARASIPA